MSGNPNLCPKTHLPFVIVENDCCSSCGLAHGISALDNFVRVWVNTEKYWIMPHDGMRRLDENDRRIIEFSSVGNSVFKGTTIYSNQTCMRNIEVMVLDEGIRKFI